jgi:hypothetical protein
LSVSILEKSVWSVMLAGTLAAATVAVRTDRTAPTTAPVVRPEHADQEVRTTNQGSFQVADEITRRLRRLHVQVLREVELRPYDPAGVVC